MSDRGVNADRVKNVYFLWGRGKTTAANELRKSYGFRIYDTDGARERLWRRATPDKQPWMCRDLEKEYGVKDYWLLPKELICEREKHFLEEATPMMLDELAELAAENGVVICEGDIDERAILSISSNCVYLCNKSQGFDWFDRPDHRHMLDSIRLRTDLSDTEKREIIEKAYGVVGQDEGEIPEWVSRNNVKVICWDESKAPYRTASEVAEHFGFGAAAQ